MRLLKSDIITSLANASVPILQGHSKQESMVCKIDYRILNLMGGLIPYPYLLYYKPSSDA